MLCGIGSRGLLRVAAQRLEEEETEYGEDDSYKRRDEVFLYGR